MPTPHPLDGGLFDVLTIIVGIFAVFLKVASRYAFRYDPIFSAKTSVDFLHGCVVFPFLMLALYPVANWLAPYTGVDWLPAFLEMIKDKNSGSVALAGGVGLFFVLGELTTMT